ncbi:MAG: hypothetical protein HYS13_24305 [Planctomycetia bacterium]|nr:hypothetical protein [Planctomycetia bacterium]
MTRLLVSVRSREEAEDAISAGADILDVKEPSHGSLGRAEAGVIEEVLAAAGGRVPVSAALGELAEGRDWNMPPGLAWFKLGLAGCAAADWQSRWLEAVETASARTSGPSPVAVVYADWELAEAPAPEDVLAEGGKLGCTAALLDTFNKSRGALVDLWGLGDVADFIRRARDLGMLAVVGGSLTAETLPAILELSPDVVAVRGAACEGGRDGAICAERIRRLREIVDGRRTTM